MSAPRLVIFDVDGTISDSQAQIVAAMADAFAAVDQPVPARAAVLGIVGLSLEQAMPKLAPGLRPEDHQRMADGYRAGYNRRMAEGGDALVPLYPGIRAVIEDLAADPDTRLAIATGKSLRGLIGLLEAHDLSEYFVSLQVADHHPSKPHPSMLLTALAETGIGADRAVMIGDTSYDMDMARAAGIAGIAVGWGYHPAHELRAARAHVNAAAELPAAIERVLAGV